MADQKGKDNHLSSYKYAAMSNLVLQADKRFVTRRGDENTGDPESLAGRINIREMGSRMAREDAAVQKKKPKGPSDIERGSIREGEDVLEREQKKRKRDGEMRGQGLLSQQDLLVEDLRYRPRTPATRATYDLIMTIIGRKLGDVPAHVTRSAADAVLEYLKDENLKDFDKKREIDDIIGTMGSKEFNELVNLGKKITDYDAQDEDETMANVGETEEGAEIDDVQGVAVVFDEDDEDEDGVAQTYEVRDEDESSEEDLDEFAERNGAKEAATAGGAGIEDGEVESDEDGEGGMVIESGTGGVSSGIKKEDDNLVAAHEIDAYWLQRQIGQIYKDAHVQQEKTQEALNILSGVAEDGEDKPLREIENELMELFDYEHHELVSKLVLNRDKV
ncbi:Pre-mRNA-splicing helicase BRR2, partial [Cryomyces antarcticus]